VGAGLAGIFLAWLFYVARPGLAGAVAHALGGVYKLVYNKYYVDEVYDALVVHPVRDGASTVLWKGIDLGVIDGLANGLAARARDAGGLLRHWQSGYIRNYAAWVVLGSIAAIAAITWLGGAR
jgi:NADH-quinone oxidoreductase subunit L